VICKITIQLEWYENVHDYLEIANDKENKFFGRDAKDNHFINDTIVLLNYNNKVTHREETFKDDETKKENEIKTILLKNVFHRFSNDNKIIHDILLNRIGFKLETK